MESQVIENKVAKSGLITLDLETFYPKEELVAFDIAPFLFHGLMLKEKDYRAALETFDWKPFEGKILCVFCSTDAILAPWSFMLVVQHAAGNAKRVIKGTVEEARSFLFLEKLIQHDWTQYALKRVLIKGCSDKAVSENHYALATEKLIEVGVNRIMYGEACSFVPVFRNVSV